MDIKQIVEWYENIKKHKLGEKISPHKTLAVLFALTKILKNERWIEYNNDAEALEALISQFDVGKISKPNCLYPLWRLRNDNRNFIVWETSPKELPMNKSGDIAAKDAREKKLKVGFSDEIYLYLRKNLQVVNQLIIDIIDANFPETWHDQLIETLGIGDLVAVGPPLEFIESHIKKPKRDPNFPKSILPLYDYRCCFCQLKIYCNQNVLPLDAAHIHWVANGGDHTIYNGLSLCPTHHRTFDRGIWTLDEKKKIVISTKVLIDVKTDIFFRPFEGKSILESILDKKNLPKIENILWHQENVFLR